MPTPATLPCLLADSPSAALIWHLQMQLQSSPAELDGRQMSVKGNFETSVKHMTPLSSESEQHVVLDEYFIHLGQFSIAINRIVCAVIEVYVVMDVC